MNKVRWMRVVALLALCALLLSCTPRDPMDAWRRAAALDAHDTAQQLYEKALAESTLVVYTESTRIFQVKESFEMQYPGLTVEVHHMRGADLLSMLRKNAQLGEYHCDIAVCSDSNGIVSQEFVPNGVLHAYVPWDMAELIQPEHRDGQLEYVAEVVHLFYNNRTANTPPVSNLWELTEPAWRGRVYMADPAISQHMFALFAAVVQSDELMAQAYEDYYGVAPPGHELSPGALFWQRLLDNDLQFVNTGHDGVEIVGAYEGDAPPVTFTTSSILRTADLAYHVAPAYELEPFMGLYHPYSVMLAGGSKNVNTAKLFIRWMLGETDGTGAGYEPYDKKGVWPVRDGFSLNGQPPLDELSLLHIDKRDIYEHRDDYFALWELLLS